MKDMKNNHHFFSSGNEDAYTGCVFFFIWSIAGLGDCVLCWIRSEVKGINVELKSYLGVLLVRETV